jgi:hypothetical protein
MPRSKGRKGPRDDRNESGASTVAGPSRPRALAPARPRYDEEDESDEDEPDSPPHSRLRLPPDRFALDGTPIASGYAKRKRKPPARPDDSPDPHQRRRCDRCKQRRLLADFASARGQVATCRDCRAQFAAAREENRRRADEERAAGLRELFREFGPTPALPSSDPVRR